MKEKGEKNEWLFKTCFKVVADKNAPIGVRIGGPLLGASLLIIEPIARLSFWRHEKDNK